MRDLDNLFGGYVHLRQFPREAEALHTLRKVASCVKPIMRKRGWRVGQLCEFFPEQANLWGLNINHGETINVLDTLLHELCHNWIGPHNAEFHKLWDDLRDEWSTLQIKGFSGEGFLGKGRQLGGQRVPMHEIQRRAHAAAVERSKQPQGAGGQRLGGRPVNRDVDIRNVIVDAIQRRNSITDSCGTGDKGAETASQDALLNGYKTKEDMDDANELAIQDALFELMEIEEERKLRGEPAHPTSPVMEGLSWSPEHGLQPIQTPPSQRPVPPPHRPPTQRRPSYPPTTQRPGLPPPVPFASRPEFNPHGQPISRLVREAESKNKKKLKKPMPASASSSSTSLSLSAQSSNSSGTWQCPTCTLINSVALPRCDACEAPQPTKDGFLPVSPVATSGGLSGPPAPARDKKMGWNCRSCGTFMESQWWTCSFCGRMKVES